MDPSPATIQYVRVDHRGLDVLVPQQFLERRLVYLKHLLNVLVAAFCAFFSMSEAGPKLRAQKVSAKDSGKAGCCPGHHQKLGSGSVSCSTNVRLTSVSASYDEESGSLCEGLFTPVISKR